MGELFLASREGDIEKVKNLLTENKKGAEYSINVASHFGQLNLVKFLLSEFEIDITRRESLAVCLASENGHLETVKFLVTGDREPGNKADIASAGNEAIKEASKNGHLEIVKFLLAPEREPKVDITSKNWAFVCASQNGGTEIVKFLYESKVDISVDNNEAIQCASKYGHLETVKYLLSKGADFSKLTPEHKKYFRTLKVFRRWRINIFKRKLFQVVLPLYYSPGFSGALKGRKLLEEFVGEMKVK